MTVAPLGRSFYAHPAPVAGALLTVVVLSAIVWYLASALSVRTYMNEARPDHDLEHHEPGGFRNGGGAGVARAGDARAASMVQPMPARPKRPKSRAIKPPDPALRSRARKILTRLAKAYPDWGPTLDFSSPLELLVATILAAQAQDERINQVTRVLFAKYRSPADYAAAPKGVLEKDIKATGFFNLKAKRLRAMARGLLDEFGGEVPSDMDELTRLDGVGRKTASIVLGAAFGVPAVAVDRHVERVAERLRLHRAGPDIEASLRAIYPKKEWIRVTWCFVLHGRRVCRPTPLCPICPINDLCPYPKKTKTLPAALRSTQQELLLQAPARRPR